MRFSKKKADRLLLGFKEKIDIVKCEKCGAVFARPVLRWEQVRDRRCFKCSK